MAEISEPRIREIVRDELSVMQIPQRLASIEASLEHKADKADVEELRGEIKGMRGEIKALEVEQKLTRDMIKYNSRLTLGFFAAIFSLLIGILIKLMMSP